MNGLLERVMRGTFAAAPPGAFDERYWSNNLPNSSSGLSVTPESALTYDALYACVRIIAEDTSTLPVDILTKRAPGPGQDEVFGHPVGDIFNRQANDYQLAIEWREWMARIATLYPEAVSEIVPGPRGMVEQLRPVLPAWLKKETTPTGSTRYLVREPQKEPRYLGLDEVYRLPSPMGLGVIQLAKDEIGTALAANRTTSVMMKNGLTPRMALEHPGELSKTAQERLSDSISANVQGPENAGHIPIFEEGLKWIQIGVKPSDAQFLELMEYSVIQMARWLRVQPHKIGYLLKVSYASAEQFNLEHVIDTVRPWVTRIESSSKAQLFTLEPRTFLKHNIDALMRGDALSRWQVYEIQRRLGVRNANQLREKEDLNPREDAGGETYWDTQPGTGSGTSNAPGSKQAPSAADSRARVLAEAAARRVVEREREALSTRAKRHGDNFAEWEAAVTEFYLKHRAMVQSAMCIDEDAAATYCDAKAAELLSEGPSTAETWDARDIPKLITLALGGTP